MSVVATTEERTAPSRVARRTTPAAALASLGIVYGDLGTSPLYTLQAVTQAIGGHFTPEAALGVLSLILLQPAHAQAVPPGSYRASCTDIRVEDRTLTAVCRIADGREQTTSLTDVNRCVGDIGNDNGALTCGHRQPMAPYRQDRR